MKISLQTRVTPLSVIYDSDAPQAPSSGIGKAIIGFLNPYARLDEGNVNLYEYRKPYVDESGKWQMIFGMAAATVLLGTAASIFALGRLSK